LKLGFVFYIFGEDENKYVHLEDIKLSLLYMWQVEISDLYNQNVISKQEKRNGCYEIVSRLFY